MRVNKKGFNLIEIAIVLAVIGLVIGGIYVAASAVTENNRRQTMQKQLLTIVSNIRTTFATQPAFVIPTTSQLTAMQIMPGDAQLVNNVYMNPYGGQYAFFMGHDNQGFVVTSTGLSQGACIDLMTKGFGSAQMVNQIGLIDVAQSTTWQGNAVVADGISITDAMAVCNQPGSGNYLSLMFNLRG